MWHPGDEHWVYQERMSTEIHVHGWDQSQHGSPVSWMDFLADGWLERFRDGGVVHAAGT